ncbi:MAG TPA: peptidylprolyl isomerase [Blastocatellia bacterium]|nr:peptidylprolyl isomerase [Blastocatellia bacterium]
MRSRLGLWALLLCAALVASSCGRKEDPNEVAVLDTSYGQIVIEFMPDVAPKNVANFKELAREQFYDGTKFHRIIKIEGKTIGVQGGDPNTISGDPSTWGMGQPGQKRVVGEFSKTLKHGPGIVSMARVSNDPNSATSQFFICVAPNPQWDGQYSIFGKVIEGMNVVEAISRAPVAKNGSLPLDPVVIKSARIVKRQEIAH